MARSIKPDQDYKSKLLKLIPSEIIAAYMVIHGILAGQVIQVGQNDLTHIVGWSVFIALLVLTPLYLVKLHNVKSRAQVILTTISFPVWVYTIGGPFKMAGLYQPQIASCILVVWTLIIPLVINTGRHHAEQ
jgi:hypothetical protein